MTSQRVIAILRSRLHESRRCAVHARGCGSPPQGNLIQIRGRVGVVAKQQGVRATLQLQTTHHQVGPPADSRIHGILFIPIVHPHIHLTILCRIVSHRQLVVARHRGIETKNHTIAIAAAHMAHVLSSRGFGIAAHTDLSAEDSMLSLQNIGDRGEVGQHNALHGGHLPAVVSEGQGVHAAMQGHKQRALMAGALCGGIDGGHLVAVVHRQKHVALVISAVEDGQGIVAVSGSCIVKRHVVAVGTGFFDRQLGLLDAAFQHRIEGDLVNVGRTAIGVAQGDGVVALRQIHRDGHPSSFRKLVPRVDVRTGDGLLLAADGHLQVAALVCQIIDVHEITACRRAVVGEAELSAVVVKTGDVLPLVVAVLHPRIAAAPCILGLQGGNALHPVLQTDSAGGCQGRGSSKG